MLFEDITLIDEHYRGLMHQYVVVEEGVIKSISSHPPLSYTGERYSGKNKLMIPGFYNIHSHAPMTLLRGYGENLPLHRWLSERMMPFEALMDEEDKYWGTQLAIAEMLACGTVSFTDMYVAKNGVFDAVNKSGIKANLCCAAIPGLGYTGSFYEDVSYANTLYLMEQAKQTDGRVRVDLGIHAEYTSDEPIVRQMAEYALDNKMCIQLHLSETKKEHEEGKQRRGMTPAAWFKKLGVFASPVTAAHCVWIEDEDFDILLNAGATVAHNPSSNLKLGSGIAPVAKMLEKGIRVGVGTDGAGSNNNLNMMEELHLAALLQKGVNCNPLLLGSSQMMEIACRNGANAQRRENCGALSPGMHADLVVIDLDAPHLCPVFDPLANLLYAAQAGDVTMTMVDGRVLYQDGQYKTLDIEKVKYQAARTAKQKAAQAGGLPI